MMVSEDTGDDRRRHRRVPIDFPVVCHIRGTPVLGWSVNACNQGMMVRSYLPLKTVIQILGMLNKNRTCPVELEFTHKREYRAEAEIKHFHIEFSQDERCQSSIGLLMSRIERKS
jgi:hypothetical protein